MIIFLLKLLQGTTLSTAFLAVAEHVVVVVVVVYWLNLITGGGAVPPLVRW
jgi:hypothetical protein